MAEKRDSRVLKSAAWHPAFNEKHEDHIPNKLADIRYFICLSQLFSLSFSSHGLSIMIITLRSGDPWHIVWGRVTLCHAVTLYLLWHNNNQICHNKDHSSRTRVIIFRPENVFFDNAIGARNKNGALPSNVLSLVSGLNKMENSIVNKSLRQLPSLPGHRWVLAININNDDDYYFLWFAIATSSLPSPPRTPLSLPRKVWKVFQLSRQIILLALQFAIYLESVYFNVGL